MCKEFYQVTEHEIYLAGLSQGRAEFCTKIIFHFIVILAESQGALLASLPSKVRQKNAIAMSLARCKYNGDRQ